MRNRIVTAAVISVTSVVAMAMTAPGAQAAVAAPPAPAAGGGNTAVIGPLLDFFGFGSNVGAPIMCATGASFITVGFSEFQAQKQGAPITDGLEQGCAAFRDQGNSYVAAGKTMQAPYAGAVNPVVNPGIDQAADAITKLGTDYSDQMAPFGPTVAGFGSSVRYFKGSQPPTGRKA
jgi:hypothetical protein